MPQSSSPIPSVVIVGRPNVGKSTLFNAITGQRRSIVGDEPGITRDRIYGEAIHHGRKFELVDTGGIIPNDEEMIPSQILKQARVALEDAAQIIFLIDGRTEITGIDRDLAKMLRKIGKPVTLAQSGAIVLYAAEKSGKLLPASGPRRAETLKWLFFGTSNVSPMAMQVHWLQQERVELITTMFQAHLQKLQSRKPAAKNHLRICDAER